MKRYCNRIERELIALEIERNTLQALLKEQENKLKELETLKENNKKASIFIRQIAADTRINAIASIEEIVTGGLRRIYSSDYTFSLEMKEISTKESENTGLFTIVPCVEKLIEGKLVNRPIKGSNGGGLMEIISLLLRIAFGTYNGYQGVYIFDESLAAVSKDGIMKHLLIFLNEYFKELELQIILITHSAEKFSQISNMNYLIFKEDGIAKAKQITRDDIKDFQDFDVSENV